MAKTLSLMGLLGLAVAAGLGVTFTEVMAASGPAVRIHGPAARTQEGSVAPAPSRALLDQYCVSCHNETLKTGGLRLDAVDLGQVGAHAAVLEKVVRKLRRDEMPPAGRPR